MGRSEALAQSCWQLSQDARSSLTGMGRRAMQQMTIDSFSFMHDGL